MINAYSCLEMGYGFWFDWALGLVILTIIIVLIITVVNQRSKLKQSGFMLPLDILKNRYAKGEISKIEFIEKKKDLN